MSTSSRPPSSAPAAPVPTDASLEAMLAKALRLQAKLPHLKTLLLVHPHGEPLPSPLPEGALDFHALRSQQNADRLLSERVFSAQDIAELKKLIQELDDE